MYSQLGRGCAALADGSVTRPGFSLRPPRPRDSRDNWRPLTESGIKVKVGNGIALLAGRHIVDLCGV